MRAFVGLVLLLLIIGTALSSLFGTGLLPNRIVIVRFDFVALTVAAVVVLLATAASLVGVGFLKESVRRQSAKIFEAERTRAAEARRRFIRRLDHELTNPLTAIRTGLANLAAEDETSHPATLAMVNAQVMRAAALVGDLRKLADLELRPLEASPVDLSSLVGEVVEVIKDSLSGRGRRLTVSLPAAPWPLPPISGDRDLLFLAVHNLLDNALKYSGPDANVEVRGYEDGGVVALEVADTGSGIPDEETAQVVDELFRGSNALGTPGSGLGLSLVKSVCDRHGASLVVRSKVGKGTVVTLRFPIAAVTER